MKLKYFFVSVNVLVHYTNGQEDKMPDWNYRKHGQDWGEVSEFEDCIETN